MMKDRQELVIAAVLTALMLLAPTEAHAARSIIDMAMNQLGSYVQWLLHPSPELRTVYGICGLGCILFGPIVYRFVVSLPCGLLFAAIGAGLGALAGGEIMAVLGGLLGFFVGLGIGWALHQLAIFVVGAFCGWLLFSAISAAVFHSPPGIVVAILAFIVGLVAVALSALLISVISAFIGALLIAIATQSMGNVWLLAALTVIGVLLQWALRRIGKRASGKDTEADPGKARSAALGALLAGVPTVVQAPKAALDKIVVPSRSPVALAADSQSADSPAWQLLVYVEGKEVLRHRLPPAAKLRLGRDDKMDVVVPHDWVSGHHLDVDVGVDGVQIRDKGSRNGTWKSGSERIESDRPRDGDWYQMGTAQLLFRRA